MPYILDTSLVSVRILMSGLVWLIMVCMIGHAAFIPLQLSVATVILCFRFRVGWCLGGRGVAGIWPLVILCLACCSAGLSRITCCTHGILLFEFEAGLGVGVSGADSGAAC